MKATPTTLHSRAAWQKAGERGAIFVEAIIVVSSFSMMFVALVFFRILYLEGMITSRLARGGGIAYSMSGCKDVTPKQWIANDAKKEHLILPPNPPEKSQAQTTEPVGTSGSADGASATQNIEGLSGGSGFLNPIAEVADQTTVWGGTKGTFSGTRKIFKKSMHPRSYVTCGDIVRNGSFDEVFGYVQSTFDSRVKTK